MMCTALLKIGGGMVSSTFAELIVYPAIFNVWRFQAKSGSKPRGIAIIGA
jgi:hypothetical protein